MDYLKYTEFIKNKTFQKCALGGLTIVTILGGIGYLVKNEILSSFEKIQEIQKIEENIEEEENNNKNDNDLDQYIKNYKETQEITDNQENILEINV